MAIQGQALDRCGRTVGIEGLALTDSLNDGPSRTRAR